MSNALVNVEIVGKVVEDFSQAETLDHVRNDSLREIKLQVKNDFLEDGIDILPVLVRVRDFNENITKDSVIAISGTLFTEDGFVYILAKKIVVVLLQEKTKCLI